MTTALVHHYKADANVYKDAGTTLCSDGDTVQQWNDQVGTLHLTMSSATHRPMYNTNQLNSLPGIKFLASGSPYDSGVWYRLTTANTSFGNQVDADYEIMAVFKLNVWQTDSHTFQGPLNAILWGCGNDFVLSCRLTPPAPSSADPQGIILTTGHTAPYLPSDLKTGHFCIMDCWADKTDASTNSQVNGGTAEKSFQSPGIITTQPFSIGGPGTVPVTDLLYQYANMEYCEILMYNCKLDDTTRANAIAYLNGKWAVY